MSRETWLAERRTGIGGSDSPAILGVNPWRTARDVALDKMGLKPDHPPNRAMERGLRLEPMVAKMYQERHPERKIRRRNTILRHPKHDWMLGNIDREISGGGILEIKCPGLSAFSRLKREGLPDYYQIQLQHYLAVTGRRWGAYAIFNAELWEMIDFEVSEDLDLQNLIIEKCGLFWKALEAGAIPEDSGPAIDLPPTRAGEVLKISSMEWNQAVEDLKEAREILASAKELEDAAKSRLEKIMGDYTVAESPGARIYNRWQEGKVSIDTKMAMAERPDLDWDRWKKQGYAYRTFKAYFLKGGDNE